MDENERKRKRETDPSDDDVSDLDAPGKERPREGMKIRSKKQKKDKSSIEGSLVDEHGRLSQNSNYEQIQPSKQQTEDGRRKTKAEKRKEKINTKPEKQTMNNRTKAKESNEPSSITDSVQLERSNSESHQQNHGEKGSDTNIGNLSSTALHKSTNESEASTTTPSPTPKSPASLLSAVPSESSSSSIVPPLDLQTPITTASSAAQPQQTEPDISSKSGKISKLPKIDHEVLKARLQARIAALRAARHADGIDGKPARNRAELLEARRRKQDQRKQHKKELRKQAKEDEQRAKAEAELARLRGSGSPLTGSDIFSPRQDSLDTNFSFGRVKFADGEQLDTNHSGLVSTHRKKGPSDTKSALQVAERKEARINGLDDMKRADIVEKDAWLNAKKKAHGERVRDDTDLLRKTLKRKDKDKQKSEREWNDRITGVQRSQELRQRKREENIQKRKDEKRNKGKGGKIAKKSTRPKSRPGFEGSFRSKTK
jgi:hypothetical protein